MKSAVSMVRRGAIHAGIPCFSFHPREDPAPVLPGGFGDVAGTIMEVVEREHIDMVVISTHGISGWHPLVFDSIAGMLVGKQRTGDPLLNAAFVADQPLEMSNSEQTPVLG